MSSWYVYGNQGFSEQYVYPVGQNNGQISSVVGGYGRDGVSYQYDKLKRLISASSTVGWSQSYTYDGFGNMTHKSGSFNVLTNPATNQMIGFNYDANGNLIPGQLELRCGEPAGGRGCGGRGAVYVRPVE